MEFYAMETTNRTVARAQRAREITGLGKSELYRKSNDPEDQFPAAIKIGDHSLAWFEDELITWQESRPRAIEKRAQDNGSPALSAA